MIEPPSGKPFAVFHTEKEFFRAAVELYKSMEDEGEKPGSEHWSQHDTPASDVYRRIQERWAELTDMEPWMMPYTLESVKNAWIALRKAGLTGRDQIGRWAGVGIFGSAIPPDSSLFQKKRETAATA